MSGARLSRPACGMAGVLAFCALAAGPSLAAPDLPPQWPDTGALDGIAGQQIQFPSHSPFTLADVGAGPDRDPATTGIGTLFLAKKAKVWPPGPAVVMVHGAAGVLSQRELTYGRQLAAMGVTTFVVDAFAARRDIATGFVQRLLAITEAMVLADAFSALRHLASRPEVDPHRVVLIGFSYGGLVATYAAYAQVAERYAPDGPHFAGHVAFYAPCIARFDDTRATGAPVLMLSGSEDAIVDIDRCAEIDADLKSGGAEVERIVYPRAYHQWDGAYAGPFMIGRNLAPCSFTVERDGTVRDDRTFLPVDGPFLRKLSLWLCVDDEGYLIGRDARVRGLSNRDLSRFLNRVFGG